MPNTKKNDNVVNKHDIYQYVNVTLRHDDFAAL